MQTPQADLVALRRQEERATAHASIATTWRATSAPCGTASLQTTQTSSKNELNSNVTSSSPVPNLSNPRTHQTARTTKPADEHGTSQDTRDTTSPTPSEHLFEWGPVDDHHVHPPADGSSTTQDAISAARSQPHSPTMIAESVLSILGDPPTSPEAVSARESPSEHSSRLAEGRKEVSFALAEIGAGKSPSHPPEH